MTKRIVRCTEETDDGARRAVPAQEAFLDGYNIAERQLEGVPIRIFQTEAGDIDAEICLSDAAIKARFIDREEVRRETLEWVEQGRFDVLASSKKLADDHMMIHDDALPPSEQPFRAAPDFVLHGIDPASM